MTPPDPDLSARKAALRRHYRELSGSRADEGQTRSLFEQLAKFQAGQKIPQDHPTLAFVGVRGEFDTIPELDRRVKDGAKIYIPRCEGAAIKDGIMEFYRYTGSANLVEGPYGLLEPKPEEPLPQSLRPLVWVPGLAFDRNGARLGKGGGFYDRYLARPQMRRALTIGLCPDEALAPPGQIPTGPLDVRVDWVVTPTRLLESVASGPAH